MFENNSIWLNAVIFLGSAISVWLAGARLARYADTIATKSGLGQELLGILLLGGVTSLPEMAVAVSATSAGSPELSVNDVLGSASVNIVILAAADAVYGRHALTSAPGTPRVMLQGTLGILLLSMVVGSSISGDVLVGGMGVWSWLLLAAFMAAIWLVSKSQDLESWVPAQRLAPEAGRAEEAGAPDNTSMRGLILRTVGVGLVILGTGFLLARSAEALAGQTGLGTSFFGAVLLGASTSLPELSTVLAAVRLRRYEMAMADVFGTNMFNVTIIVLVDALHPGGPILPAAGRFAAFGALLAIVLTALFVVGMIERRNQTVLRMGLDSLAVLACYAAGVAMLYQLR